MLIKKVTILEITYRLATIKDLEEVHHLVKDAIEAMVRQHINQWDKLYPDKMILEEDIRKEQLYVGTVNQKIAVIYALNQECDEAYSNGNWKYIDKPFYVIHRLCVNPAFQNQGVAKNTMKHIEEEVRARGIETIRLDAFIDNPYAVKLYVNLGYEKVGFAHWRKGRFYLMEKAI